MQQQRNQYAAKWKKQCNYPLLSVLPVALIGFLIWKIKKIKIT
jgi:hypothetical protein